MSTIRDDVTDRWALAGDALVVSSGVFAWLSSIVVAIALVGGDVLAAEVSGVGPLGILASVLSVVTMFASTLGAPVLVWLLHGRGASWLALLGAVVAGPLVLLAAGVLAPVLASIFGFLLGPLTDWEFAGPVALLVLVGVGFVIAAARTMIVRRPDGERRELRTLRWICVGGLVILTVLVVAALVTGLSGEMGEALIFGMMFGISAAVMVTGADISDRLGHRSARFRSA